ncbi:carbamoyltransferase C-terminal domain-containing protein [Nocardia sp. BMG51109]|uniref:carbamoyltransferase family protein n=1 Tax=Nocardia sp. BMG51109 TaxID=1056816 RepID=UPI0004663A72|nr:carbamoyltransferase C-terminal domain-containing protein [Nocardia sp. BMG51109]
MTPPKTKTTSATRIDPVPARERLYLGIMTGPHDPSAAVVRNGRVLALADEERFNRHKHAFGSFPINAVRYCLDAAKADLPDIHRIAVPWDVTGYSDGRIAAFYRRMNDTEPVDAATKDWQRRQLSLFGRDNLEALFGRELGRTFGARAVPEIVGTGHHYTHAFQAGHEGPFTDAVVVVLDGSGDTHTGTVWLKTGPDLALLREIEMPHSLGWFYAAITEYLGFDSSDGEYKVMGLAAYGRPDPGLDALVGTVLYPAGNGIDYRLATEFIHYGRHTYSGRFTDRLAELFGRPPRSRREPVEQWHRDLALAAQTATERAACRLVSWAVQETGVRTVCVGGGVAMNVKANAAIAALPEVAGLFAHPGCADNGAAAGAALAAWHADTGALPQPLHSVALGPEYSAAEIADILRSVRTTFEHPDDVAPVIARDLARGAVVGWFCGRMEAGARALGHRSILADPRTAAMRDRVNAVIKHREPWRPFAPSIRAEDSDRYADHTGDLRFMMMSVRANDRLRADAPAVVHVDGTSRVHRVVGADNPGLHRLLTEFGRITGVPILLNTSFNLAGEPIVCTPLDALRTFYASGMDILVLEQLVVRKSV